jgi:hypothetical protein
LSRRSAQREGGSAISSFIFHLSSLIIHHSSAADLHFALTGGKL